MPFSYQEAGELYNTSSTITSREQRVAEAARTQREFAALDPATVRGYLVVVIKDANPDGTVECITYNGGTGADKEVMLEALSETLQKQQAAREQRGRPYPAPAGKEVPQ